MSQEPQVIENAATETGVVTTQSVNNILASINTDMQVTTDDLVAALISRTERALELKLKETRERLQVINTEKNTIEKAFAASKDLSQYTVNDLLGNTITYANPSIRPTGFSCQVRFNGSQFTTITVPCDDEMVIKYRELDDEMNKLGGTLPVLTAKLRDIPRMERAARGKVAENKLRSLGDVDAFFGTVDLSSIV